MGKNPVVDENLRLLLAPGHEDYLIARIRNHFIANGILISVCVVAPLIAAGLVELLGVAPGIALGVAGFSAFFAPLVALIVIRNFWVAGRLLRHYREHEDFLFKYNRSTDPEYLRIERYYQAFRQFSGSILIVLIFLVFLYTAMVSMNMPMHEYGDVATSNDKDICLLANLGWDEAIMEARKRRLTDQLCDLAIHSGD